MCQILGYGMSAKIWDATIQHAQTCASGSKYHAYIHQNGLSIIFNNIFQWVAIKENSHSEHRAADSLHHKEKVLGTKKNARMMMILTSLQTPSAMTFYCLLRSQTSRNFVLQFYTLASM
jgi:hypothetical protein